MMLKETASAVSFFLPLRLLVVCTNLSLTSFDSSPAGEPFWCSTTSAHSAVPLRGAIVSRGVWCSPLGSKERYHIKASIGRTKQRMQFVWPCCPLSRLRRQLSQGESQVIPLRLERSDANDANDANMQKTLEWFNLYKKEKPE